MAGLERWRSAATLGGLCLAVVLVRPPAALGVVSVGVRYGWADADEEIFKGSGYMDQTNLAGVQVLFDVSSAFRIELASEYVSEPFEFEEGLIAGFEAAGEGDYEDLTLYLSGKIDILSLPGIPLRIYVGGGVNAHFIDVELTEVDPAQKGAPQPKDEWRDAIEEETGKKTRTGWQGLVGVSLELFKLPLSVFAEGRYAGTLEDREVRAPAAKSFYAGLALDL